MTAISFTNSLYGAEALKRAQRRHARFVNTAMTATLLGAVSSDQLDDGRVVSGVGGQHDLVTMAHELAEARSIIALRSTRRQGSRVVSNIVWQYANATIPRHLRDLIVTEYGVADLRGRSDRDVIVEMLNVADGSAQQTLQLAAMRAGKLERSFERPSRARHNNPDRIAAVLEPARRAGLLPVFPLGTEMTDIEKTLIGPLTSLKDASPARRVRCLLAGLAPGSHPREQAALSRLGLGTPSGLAQYTLRALVLGAMRV